VIRTIICFLLISLNVVYAFENHEGEFQGVVESHMQISNEFHSADADDPYSDHSKHPAGEHTCHLGHCNFYISSFQFVARIVVTSTFFSKEVDVPSPFIDEETRPPIFS
jgi:hypothetical protein|tara:strand:+ start:28992 stop:29318 length:327 start_codon:yes stop_codon:yes gene_type:complete